MKQRHRPEVEKKPRQLRQTDHKFRYYKNSEKIKITNEENCILGDFYITHCCLLNSKIKYIYYNGKSSISLLALLIYDIFVNI